MQKIVPENPIARTPVGDLCVLLITAIFYLYIMLIHWNISGPIIHLITTLIVIFLFTASHSLSVNVIIVQKKQKNKIILFVF